MGGNWDMTCIRAVQRDGLWVLLGVRKKDRIPNSRVTDP